MLVLLSACAAGPRTVSVSASELQALVAKRFPVERRLFEVFELRLSAPAVRLLPQDNRLATELDLMATDRLSGRALQGWLGLSFALRYEGADGTLRLMQPRVERFDVGDGSAKGSRLGAQAQHLVGPWAEQLLDDWVVYRLKSEQLAALRAAGYRPGTLTVTAQGVDIVLLPLP
jgi:hypothetical protein